MVNNSKVGQVKICQLQLTTVYRQKNLTDFRNKINNPIVL